MKDDYKEFQSKHKLPDFNELDNVFEVSSISSPNFLMRDIRRHIVERLRANAEILEDIIHPNSTVSAFHECTFFNDDEKKKLYDLYARMMKLIRNSNLLDVKLEDEQDAKFIVEIANIWPEIRTDLHSILEKLHSAWSEKEISESPVSSYFG